MHRDRKTNVTLTHSWRKSMDCFLYNNGLPHERVIVFSPSIHWDTFFQNKKLFFSKLLDKYCQNLKNPWGIVNIPFCDAITKFGTFLFVTSFQSINLVSRISNSMMRNKKCKQIFQFSEITTSMVYTGILWSYVLKIFMMSLYTETDRLPPFSLSKYKANLYFKKLVTVNNESCSLLKEHVATTWPLKIYFWICLVTSYNFKSG